MCDDLQNTCPNVYVKKKAGLLFSLLYCCCRRPCPGDAVFCCERESTLFGLPKEDTTRNQWLSCTYSTVPEQFNPNIRVCAAHVREDLFPESGRVANNAGLHKTCFYIVGQFQHWFINFFIYKAHLKTTQGWPKCCTDQSHRMKIYFIYLFFFARLLTYISSFLLLMVQTRVLSSVE